MSLEQLLETIPRGAPDEALARNYVAATNTLGGFLVQTQNLGDMFIELLRNKSQVLNLGARYRFKAAGADWLFRPVLLNLTDEYGWNVSSSGGFTYIAPRALTLPSGARIPTLRELEAMSPDQLDELLGLKPKFDMPGAARRSMSRVGVLSATEGGLPSQSVARQPANLVRAALDGNKGVLVSRWGHILLRRALASRLDRKSVV